MDPDEGHFEPEEPLDIDEDLTGADGDPNIAAAAAAVARLAEDDYVSDIPGVDRKDEVGSIATNLVSLRDRLDKAARANEKERDASNAATKIQSAIKGHLERKRLKERVRQDIANVGESFIQVLFYLATINGSEP